MRGLFYHFSPAKDIGHGVHLFRLASALAAGGRTELTLLRDASADYPPASAWKYGPVISLKPGTPAARSARILRELRAASPDFLATAFFPLGRTGCAAEIEPVLKAARAAGVALYSTVPMPYFSHNERALPELFRFAQYYDRIFINSPLGYDLRYMAAAAPAERRVSALSFARVFDRLKDKLCFTGYVLPEKKPARPRCRGGKFILVHRFCGPTSPGIVTCAILAKKLLKSRLPMVIVSGPASTPGEMRGWRALLAKEGAGIKLLKETPNFFGLLAGCAVSVGTAGGTVYEALYLNRRSVLIPYKGRPGAERSDQLARAAMLRDLAGAAVLDYDSLTPASLAAAMDAALLDRSPGCAAPAGIFSGAEVFARTVRHDLGGGKRAQAV
jgi:predicted glycosyltransferase